MNHQYENHYLHRCLRQWPDQQQQKHTRLVVTRIRTRLYDHQPAHTSRHHGKNNILAPDYLPLKDNGSLVVLTHDTKATAVQSNVLFTSDSPEKIVAQLAAKGHDEVVIIGGTETVSAFFKAGLVNEIILVIEPVLFSSGLPLLKDLEAEYKLSLLDVSKLNDNTVQLHYTIQK